MCETVIAEFLTDPENITLTIYYDKQTLVAHLGMPNVQVGDLTYFIKEQEGVTITEENFFNHILFGTINNVVEGALLEALETVFAPTIFNIKQWPDSVKSSFSSQLNYFLSDLTNLRYKMCGLTVIYVPYEARTITLEQASKNRQLVERLEGVMLNWTCQIRVALGDREQSSPTEMLGLVDELEFWKYRFFQLSRDVIAVIVIALLCIFSDENLSGVKYQLENENLIHVTNILQAAQSRYVRQFFTMVKEIEDALTEAQSNICFLQILEEPTARQDWWADTAGDVAVKNVSNKYGWQLHYWGEGMIAVVLPGMVLIAGYVSPNVDLDIYEQYINELQGVVVRSPRRVVLLGDFNCKTTAAGSNYTNRRGEIFTDMMVMTGLFCLNDTYEAYEDHRSVLDLTLVDNRWDPTMFQWCVMRAETASDHYATLLVMKDTLTCNVDIHRPLHLTDRQVDIIVDRISSKLQEAEEPLVSDRYSDGISIFSDGYCEIVERADAEISNAEYESENDDEQKLQSRDVIEENRSVQVYRKYHKEVCVIDDESQALIFNQVDTFMERCRDVVEICDCMVTFARLNEEEDMPNPTFGLTRGVELEKICVQVEKQFLDNLAITEKVQDSILDVRSARWYEEMFRLRTQVKEMEVMIENLLIEAFASVGNVFEALDVLQSLYQYSKRPNLYPKFEQRTVQVLNMYLEEMQNARHDLVLEKKCHPAFLPRYAGRATVISSKKQTLQNIFSRLEECAWLINIPLYDEIILQYTKLMTSLDEIILGYQEKWTNSVKKSQEFRLQRSLLTRSPHKPGCLKLNIDKKLVQIFEESKVWLQLGLRVTVSVDMLLQKYKDVILSYRGMESIVIGYNQIVRALSDKERVLFRELIHELEVKIQPLCVKYNWNLDGLNSHIICADILSSLENAQEIVTTYKNSNVEIFKLSEAICKVKLIDISLMETSRLQVVQHKMKIQRLLAVNKLTKIHNKIFQHLMVVLEGFFPHLPNMNFLWMKYVEKIDNLVEEALCLCVENSLLGVLEVLHGDGSTGPLPLIHVVALLKNREICFVPNMVEILTVFHNLLTDIVITLQTLPRLFEKFRINQTIKKVPYAAIIANDYKCKKNQSTINREIAFAFTKLKNFLNHWLPFRAIWETDRDYYIQCLRKRSPSAETFNKELARYLYLLQLEERADAIVPAHFLLINVTLLKETIIGHIKCWSFRLFQLLAKIINFQIEDIYRYTIETGQRVFCEPKTLKQLQEYRDYHNQVLEEIPKMEKLFQPIKEKIALFEKFETPLPGKIFEREDGLEAQWKTFLDLVKESKEMLNVKKDNFQAGLIKEAEEFKIEAKVLLDEFLSNGPFSSDWTPDEALKYLKELKAQLGNMKNREAALIRDLALFGIEVSPSTDLQKLEAELDLIISIWEMAKQWDELWLKYKQENFWELKADEMETTANELYRTLTQLARDLRDRNWEIIEHTRNRVDIFRRVIPLITDLKNPAMRERHWNSVKQIVNVDFDQNSPSFSLEAVIKLNLQEFAESINEISDAATREMQIENGLKVIKETWDNVVLDMVPHKDKGIYRIKAVDDIFQALEENLVALSSMKSTRFVEPFIKTVDFWEKGLSLVMEVLEAVLNVQRQYLYLENIFLGEDIRKQLPKEASDFDSVLHEWRELTCRMNEDNYAFKVAHYPGLYGKLGKLDEKLEKIQRALESYLETKRQIFPRFYFISNDDLLEILGNSKNPEKVQPHFKKCFDNINKLKMSKNASTMKMEGSGMFSAEGEFVDFIRPVILEGAVEMWLCVVETLMRVTLKDELKSVRAALRKNLNKRDKWIKDWPGQLCITASQIQWTLDCTRTLMACKAVERKTPLRKLRKRQNQVLSKFSETIRGSLTKLQRSKVVALVTIEIHARDVIDKMYKANCLDISAFEWLSQLRFYWDRDVDDCIVRQTNTHFMYGYEYLGNSGRLVITPLTDRCYITLTTALHLHRGGSPKGPAGTGKTETVKDLGKSLAYYVIVINCSEGLDYKSMGHMFAGLAQSGAWGCFDEFNRINIEVLSVVAQQILSILSALAHNVKSFTFESREIKLIPTCGIFITMNPGYAGRTELPDNLKSMFRPISMMVPDSMLIAEITLFGEGFRDTRNLAKKVYTLFSLARQQLSKQDHYDFGLRGMVSLLRYAGRKRRLLPNMPDDEVVLLAMRDMNVAKLTTDDLPLFSGITGDLFPSVEVPAVDYSIILKALQKEMQSNDFQEIQSGMTKVLQLYETKGSRHSVMLVGKTGSAKSTTWKLLKDTMTSLKKGGVAGFESVTEYVINPKALNLGELYGEFNLQTNEWLDGVLSSIMRKTCSDEGTDEKWILFDGPVDAVWIENMNSVMDDNKVLTLVNSERITMPEQVSLLFEVEDLAVASPATVSRCGMVYNDYTDFGWNPFVYRWLKKFPIKTFKELLYEHVKQYVGKTLKFISENCEETVAVPEICRVMSLCKMLEVMATPENGVVKQPVDMDAYKTLSKLLFLFCLTWSICCTVDLEGRRKVDTFIREMESLYPLTDSIYEYYVDVEDLSFKHWEMLLDANWKFNQRLPFFKINVPTVDTLRYQFLTKGLIGKMFPVLLVGVDGTGKTTTALSAMDSLDISRYTILTVNMSAQTTSNNVQETIESRVEKRTKGVYVPYGGKTMITFMDDFNMPAKEVYGAQPPLELIRQWIDYGFWYDRHKQFQKYVKEMLLVGAMGPPGGGRNIISNRLLSRFSVINLTFPSESDLMQIFCTMLNQHIHDFDDSIKQISSEITSMTIDLYGAVIAKMLPTPAKMHYRFNLRDISKVFQGLLRSSIDLTNNKMTFLRLWVHESYRVFSDRLIDEMDQDWYFNQLGFQLGKHFDLTFNSICPGKEPPIFCDYFNSYGFYEDIQDFEKIRNHCQTQMGEYNKSPGVIKMDLVLFKDAVEHICRISRIISQPRGNVLLIGIGGSGRQSLSRLSAWLCSYNTFQIQTTKNYKVAEFKEDLKKLYFSTGVKDINTSFLFNDNQVAEESFLEIVNNILSTGEVSNLYKPEELEEVRNNLADAAKKQGKFAEQIYGFFIDRVRSNLHIIVCMSPIGDQFRIRLRQYPALINCTTIDWFQEWPKDALLEVAYKFLTPVDLLETITGLPRVSMITFIYLTCEDRLHQAVAHVFSEIHVSVSQTSRLVLLELKRHNYVTPTNYLELVAGYIVMLASKRKELAESANKLRNGLSKIDETRVKVEEMSVELETATIQVNNMTVECDDFLVIILNQKREADDQQKAVSARSVRIKEEEKVCQHLADIALADLQEAMPALEEAMLALEALNKKDITEIRSYGRPPARVEMVMEAVMILKGVEPTWAEAKRQLGDVNFLNQLKDFDKDHISDKTLKKIAVYTSNEEFEPDKVGIVSVAAKSLCLWVRAIEKYGKVYRIVAPKKAKLDEALKSLHEKQAALAEAMAKLEELQRLLEKLRKDYEEKLAMKEELRQKAELLRLKLERAGQLLSGLSGERVRWEQTVADLDRQFDFLPGDCLLGTAFVSYMGPFLSQYRERLMTTWKETISETEVECSPRFDLIAFLVDPTTIREWNIQGLPSDSFSTENGIIVTMGSRWPLVIDPQCQAWRWIKNKEGPMGLVVLDLNQPNYLKMLEQAITNGTPVLIQNVSEVLDPSLTPVLQKNIVMQGGKYMLKFSERLVLYNQNFKLFLTTKIGNPHFSPEICTTTTLVNFAIKEEGLEAQLLGIVVRKEKPQLEEQKVSLVLNIAAGKRTLIKLEDDILRLLNESKGSLLDNVELLTTLQTSNETSIAVNEQLRNNLVVEVEIDSAREGYRESASRSSVLFFVLNDMSQIDPMYQFSLDSYIQLFINSIEKSKKTDVLEERIKFLNDYHTYAVYRNTCRGLFEKHKLLFSFHMVMKILDAAGKMIRADYLFLLKGGVVLNREEQPENPCIGWLNETCWDNITELDKLGGFHGVVSSFEQYTRDWKEWYSATEPESLPLIGEWQDICSEFQRMLFVRSLRPDRLTFCISSFVVTTLGARFTEPPVLDVKTVLDDSNNKTPLIFVLSPGVDPTPSLIQLAESSDMASRFHSLSLGQGQAQFAKRLIEIGTKEGNWIFLANCHLSLSWMPSLDKIIEEFQSVQIHKDFRLWLSSSPHPQFPISILQNSLKMTTEPPKGLKANMKRMYNLITDSQFTSCQNQLKYKKLLFALCFFHSVIIERKKFEQLGWNIVYSFNDSDFDVSENLLSIYLDEYTDTPWDALKYLIAGVCYGGHVTDDWDRRLLMTYINQYFCDDALTVQHFRLSSLPQYYIPKDGSLQSYKDFVITLPNVDQPQLFGQHTNADITCLIIDTKITCETLMSLQVQKATESSDDKETTVMHLAKDVLSKVPGNIDYNRTSQLIGPIKSPLDVVLLQEVSRYNILLEEIQTSLEDLRKGILGLVVMSSNLEEIYTAIFEGRVPSAWLKAYPSLKTLGAWTRDLMLRVDHFSQWALSAHPPLLFWLSAYTFPTGLLTAVLQTSARHLNVSIDLLGWEFSPQSIPESDITIPPAEGVFVRGLFLEGAGWNSKALCLAEPIPMQLIYNMPVIHFRPCEQQKRRPKGMYTCPTYYYPIRGGTDSHIVAVDLKTGNETPDHWIKRGTAMLLSLNY
ncbi:dynein heavy chain 2, axonemal kl-2 [Lycorma delicatula]|uniref:dynein heavy chain 2, axonemal kl-2 n=1 Tax=Lycorma delicatula TaxID=130591 RepID=UPI003F519FC5